MWYLDIRKEDSYKELTFTNFCDMSDWIEDNYEADADYWVSNNDAVYMEYQDLFSF